MITAVLLTLTLRVFENSQLDISCRITCKTSRRIAARYPVFQLATVQHCYPAAHASGGFALLSLFFLFKNRHNCGLAEAVALTVGWVTGLYKMLIGDHFLSHTIVSMLLAWLIILLVHATVCFTTDKQHSRVPAS